MKRAADGTEPEVLRVEDYEAWIILKLEESEASSKPDRDIVRRLAHFYRMIDFHGKRLETDPGDSYSTDLLQKLSTLALRHEAVLGIGVPPRKEPETPTEPRRPASIKREFS